MSKQVKKSAKLDRRAWLDNLVASQDWAKLKLLKQGKTTTKGRLRNREGQVVPSDMKAQTLAEYFEEVQWRLRILDGDVPNEALGLEFPIKVSEICLEEVMAACKKLRSSRACGVDAMPAEVWKCLLEEEDHRVAFWIVDFCNKVWSQRVVLDIWHKTRVIALFKKGDLGDCGNYKPIFLACVGYKLFVIIIFLG